MPTGGSDLEDIFDVVFIDAEKEDYERLFQLAREKVEPGAIYVFHVGSASQDGPALQAVIDGLRAQGYFIGAVPDVLPR